MENQIIDPPSPFATLKDWKQFLAEMRTLPLTVEVADYIRDAEAMIEEKEKAAN